MTGGWVIVDGGWLRRRVGGRKVDAVRLFGLRVE